MVRKSRFTMPPSDLADTDFIPDQLSNQEFGRRVFKLLVEREMTQSELSRASGIGRDGISRYVAGKALPTPKNLKKLADALNVAPVDLLPKSLFAAIEEDQPSIEFRQAAGHNRVWLRINRAMSSSIATKIIGMIEEEDSQVRERRKRESEAAAERRLNRQPHTRKPSTDADNNENSD